MIADNSIVRKMVYAVVLSFITGFLLMLLKGNVDEKVWSVLDMLLFQDISATKSFSGLGLFYIIGQLFIRGLQMMIVPLVISSLTLSLCNLSDPKKLGRIAKTTFSTYLIFYVIAAVLAGAAAYFVKSMGWFNVNLPTHEVGELIVMEGYNPLVTIVNAVPSNIINAMSANTAILSVVVVAIVFGIAMTTIGEKAIPFKKVLESLNEMIQYSLNFLINKLGPIAIFCMITRALAIYGIEYIAPTLVWILTTIIVSLALVCTIYPLGVFFVTGLNPFKFLKKSSKIGMFAAATNSSAATLPLNTQVCTKELGCSEEISSFVLPTGMTINMNGTTVMHMIAITFIGTAAGINVTPVILATAAFLSICSAVGTPAIPVAGTTMVYVVMMGLDFSSELCMIGYSLVLAMNYLPGMAVITLNVIGDAATNVIVNFKEKALNQDIYNA
ncbi:dicarboxylate/amino acid:cation symporter [Necropsobacter rosorum]|uniref:dicarboxylate/amino acid:cation symporter n=1 Tax=Necropsobacter rosorum TaxID=908285 RepID=UPI00050955F6